MTIAPERPSTGHSPAPPYRTNWVLVTILLLIIGTLAAAIVWLVADDDGGGSDTAAGRISGSGTIIREDRPIGGFDSFALYSAGRIIVTEAAAPSLSVETDDNLLPYLKTEVSGGRLEITAEFDGLNYNLDPTDEILFRLAVTDLSEFDIYGAGRIEAGAITSGDLTLRVFGSGDVAIDELTGDRLRIEVPGHADLRIGGTVTEQTVSWLGAGAYDGTMLQSERADVTILGAATVSLWATESLDINITGAGTVEYYGTPRVDQRITGVGQVKSLGAK
jgi:hypothetical protein